jgi:hypothetical protein
MEPMAWAADILTASRVALALLLILAVANGSLTVGAVMLVLAWLTDLFDGRLARAASKGTRLGEWDLRVDTTVGVAILVGLMLAGRASPLLVLVVIGALGGVAVLTGNPAPAMLLQGFSYAWFLGVLMADRPRLWWLPFAIIPVLLVADWRRFFRVVLRAFFKGAAALGRGETADRGPILDDWA